MKYKLPFLETSLGFLLIIIQQNAGFKAGSYNYAKCTVTYNCFKPTYELISDDDNSIECPTPKNVNITDLKIRCSHEDECTMLEKPTNWKAENNSEPSIQIDSFELKNCLPPKESLRETMNSLGVQTTYLQIQLPKGSDSLQNANFLKNLPEVSVLLLTGNLSNFKINDLAQKMPNLTDLILQDSNIKLDNGSFINFVKLKRLQLPNNNISYLQPEFFQNLTNLKYLFLWGNNLSDLRRDIFSETPNLIKLDIGRNKIRKLDKYLFAGLRNLTEIKLFENKLEEIPEELFLNNRQLELVNMKDMKTLRKIGNKLLAYLTKLKRIELSNCNISQLPNDLILGSENIKFINLEENFISELPPDFLRDAKELQSINLKRNEINNLPNDIFQNTKEIKKIDLAYNRLTSIEADVFSNMNKLEFLDLSFNQIKEIHKIAFYGTALKKLFLNNNLLSTLENYKNPFSNLKTLETLDLSQNYILALPEDLNGLSIPNIKSIVLSHNNLSSIEMPFISSFSYTKERLTIDLRHNSISRITNFRIAVYPNTSSHNGFITLELKGNPFICDCENSDVLSFFNGELSNNTKLSAFNFKDLRCATPSSLAGKDIIKEVPIEELKCKITDLRDTICDTCECFKRGFKKGDKPTLEIDCKEKNMTEIPVIPEKIENYNFELNLTNNRIKTFSTESNKTLQNVTKLDLSFNNISEVNITYLPANIKVLRLHGNNISSLNKESLKVINESDKLDEITLYNNPWRCDCDAENLLIFIHDKHNQVKEAQNISCADGTPMSMKKLNDICPFSKMFVIIWCFPIILISLVVSLVTALYYRHFYNVFIKGLFPNGIGQDSDKFYEYDIFLSYSDEDEEFVKENIVPVLEDKYKLCLQFRDWIAGEYRPQLIAKSIESSQRTIVVLSPNYADGDWNRMELRQAFLKSLKERKAHVIIILYANNELITVLDHELRAFLQMITCITWGVPSFWDKLQKGLPSRTKESKLRYFLKMCLARQNQRPTAYCV